jgi:hypothetical protein
VSPRTLATLQAAGRVTLGSALAAAPTRAAGAWIGRDAERTGAQVLAVAMGTRDAGLGAGTLAALRRGDDVRPWLAAGIAADLADLAVTLRNAHDLPRPAVAAVAAVAGGSVLLGAWLASELD